nr:itaconate transport protein [Quercus suber]
MRECIRDARPAEPPIPYHYTTCFHNHTVAFIKHRRTGENGPRSRLSKYNRFPESDQGDDPCEEKTRHERRRLRRALQPSTCPAGGTGSAEAPRFDLFAHLLPATRSHHLPGHAAWAGEPARLRRHLHVCVSRLSRLRALHVRPGEQGADAGSRELHGRGGDEDDGGGRVHGHRGWGEGGIDCGSYAAIWSCALKELAVCPREGDSGLLVLLMFRRKDVTTWSTSIVTSAERGQYIGFVTLSAILGPSLGPLIGGALTSSLGWRSIFWFLAICAGILLILVTLFFPETCRPLVGDGSIMPPKTNMTVLQLLENARQKGITDVEMASNLPTGSNVIDSNPVTTPKKKPFLASLIVLMDKETIILLAYGGLVYSGINAISASVPSLFSAIYGYDSLHIGLMYLPMAGGSVMAVSFVGKAINWNYRRHAKRLGLKVDNSRQMDFSDFPIEQARLEVLLPPLYLTAIVIIAWGWSLEARTSVAAPIVLSVVLGVAYIGVLNVFNTLITDLYRKKAGSAVAANWFVRCMFAAAMTALINPLIGAIGPGWAFTIIGASYVVFSPAIMLIMWKGLAWRRARAGKED